MRVRGLKQDNRQLIIITVASHPTWVRGLKRGFGLWHGASGDVAPCVGAWIETGVRKYALTAMAIVPYVDETMSHIAKRKRLT